jgi:hypothetical protein
VVVVAAVVAKALAAAVLLRLDGYDAAMENPPSSEQLRTLIYKVAPSPQVVETFERLGGEFGRWICYAESSAVVRS